MSNLSVFRESLLLIRKKSIAGKLPAGKRESEKRPQYSTVATKIIKKTVIITLLEIC